ncbi:MAG: nucleotidyltransferase domain-containing protein [Candidatus Aenigmatarchaeota archaeon]
MNNINRKLTAKAIDFASFAIESGEKPKYIILFGSVARGDADSDSDIDIFIESDDKKEIEGLGKNFELTKGNSWKLKGADNPVSVVVGNLEKHPMRREIESYGIVIYGLYKKFGKEAIPYSLFALDFLNVKAKANIWRKLYGYSQKVGQKKYISRGLVGKLGGKKIERGVVLIPSEHSKEFVQYLRKNKIIFKVHEIWSE